VQSLIGLAATRLQSARTYLLASLEKIVADLAAGGALAGPQELTMRMSTTFAIQESAAVVDALYHEAGASAIHNANPFERRFRDIHAVAQQVQGRRANFELVGKRMMGMETGPLVI
jgi:alkylation response protein AidB-like acyl-CoA dehydrogenase